MPQAAGPSRSQAHTAHTNQRLKPGKLIKKDQILDGTQTEDGKTNKSTGVAGKRQPTTYIVNQDGEIGVRRRIESPKSAAPSS